MKKSLLLLLFVACIAATDLLISVRTDDDPDLHPHFAGSLDCPRGDWCGNTSFAGCEDDCTPFIYDEAQCVFATTTFEGFGAEDLYMKIECDDETYEVMFFGASNCTDFRTMFNRSLGECLVPNDAPSFVVNVCADCLNTGATVGAIIGIIIGIIVVVLLFCLFQWGISRNMFS